MRIKLKNFLADLISTVSGGFIWAAGINIFIKPNLLAPGGFSGLSIVINFFLNILPIGIINIILNIPLFAIAYRKFGKRFFFSGAAAMLITSVIIDSTALFLPEYTGDILIASIFGGICSGIGLGIIYLRGIVTGGTDLLARLAEKHIGFLSYGKIIACIDFAVIITAAIAFKNIETALVSVISAYISSAVIDKILNGADKAKLLFIISDMHEKIRTEILEILHRGVTVLPAKGGYTGTDKPIMMAVCRPYELIKVKTFIYTVDKDAFVIISDAGEVDGLGFSYKN